MLIPIARHQPSGKVINIDKLSENERGLACQCVCIECGGKLVAKMGQFKVAHFAHFEEVNSQRCEESALHRLGKMVLMELKQFNLPNFPYEDEVKTDSLGVVHKLDQSMIREANYLEILSVQEEKTIGSIRSDVYAKGHYAGIEMELNIEVKVTHKVDEKKYNSLVHYGINTVECDIAHLLKRPNVSFEDVREALQEEGRQTLIYLTPNFKHSLISHAVEELEYRVEQRNRNVSQWCSVISDQYVKEGFEFPLPNSFNWRNEIIENEAVAAYLGYTLPSPVIGGMYSVRSFKHVRGAEFELKITNGLKEYSLHIVLNLAESGVKEDLDGFSYCSYKCDEELPTFEQFKKGLRWGRFKRWKQYRDECAKLESKYIAERIVALSNRNRETFSKFTNRSKHLESLLSDLFPSNHVSKYINCSLDPNWVFSVHPYEWQIIVLHNVVVVPSKLISGKYQRDNLSRYGISESKFIKNLSLLKLEWREGSNLPFDRGYFVIWRYLDFLCKKQLLRKSGKYYEKR